MSSWTKLKTAAAAAVITLLPINSVAAAPSMTPSTSAAVSRVGATLDEENGQFAAQSLLVPIVIVVVIGVGIYFLFIQEDDEPSSP